MGLVLHLVFAVLIVSFYGGAWPDDLHVPEFQPVLAGLAALAFLLIAHQVHGILVRRRLAQAAEVVPGARAWIPIPSAGVHVLHLALFAILVFAFHWPRAVTITLGLRRMIVIDDIAVLSPYLVAFLLWLRRRHELERVLLNRSWSAAESLRFHLRILALPAIPLLLLAAISDVIELIPAADLLLESFAYVPILGVMLLFAGIGLFAPALVPRLWKTRPLPSSPLRDRLAACAARTGFRCREILVWDTSNTIFNAVFLGILPRFRWVLLSDALLERLSEEQVEAVFAHEMAHSQRRHPVFLLFFTMAYFFPLIVLTGPLSAVFGGLPPLLSGILEPLVFVVYILGYFGGLLGFLQRRFELEADLYAARAVGSAERFNDALERVNTEAGGRRHAASWLHPSVAHRVEFLLACFRDERVGRRFARRMFGVRAVVVLMVLACAGAWASGIPAMHERGRVSWLRRSGEAERDAGRLRQAVAEARRLGDPDEIALTLVVLIETLHRLGEAEEAGGLLAELPHPSTLRSPVHAYNYALVEFMTHMVRGDIAGASVSGAETAVRLAELRRAFGDTAEVRREAANVGYLEAVLEYRRDPASGVGMAWRRLDALSSEPFPAADAFRGLLALRETDPALAARMFRQAVDRGLADEHAWRKSVLLFALPEDDRRAGPTGLDAFAARHL